MKNSTKLRDDLDIKLFIRITSLFFTYFDAIHELKDIPNQIASDLFKVFSPDVLMVEEKDSLHGISEEVFMKRSMEFRENIPDKENFIRLELFRTMDGKEYQYYFYYHQPTKMMEILENTDFQQWLYHISQYLYSLISFFEEIQKIRIFFQNIIDTLPEILIVFNENSYITEWRDNTDITGYHAGALAGKPVFDVVKGVDFEKVKNQLKEKLLNQEYPVVLRRIEGFIHTKNGQKKEVELNISYFEDRLNSLEYFIALGEDVSEKKELERQIRERNRKLELFYHNYTKEMKFASILQRKMMKNETRNLQGSVATTFYSPFEYVGGDYSAVLPGNDRIYFISVDVVGHSIFSAFYSSMIHSSFYNLIFYPEELDDFIYRIYQEFVELMSDDNFLSMVAGYLIPSRKEVVFANYGHPYPALYLAKQRKTVLYNEVHNKIISPLIPFEKPKINCVSYEEGDKLFVYSDGLIEQENSDENKFSALTSALESYSSKLTGADLVNAVVKERILANAENSEEIRKELSGMDVMEWEQGTDYFDDDVSLIVFEF